MKLLTFLNYVVAFGLIVATAMHVAVDRAPEIFESRVTRSARRVMQAALAILAAFFIYQVLWRGHYQNPVFTLGMCLFAIAEIVFCLAQLFPFASCETHIEKRE